MTSLDGRQRPWHYALGAMRSCGRIVLGRWSWCSGHKFPGLSPIRGSCYGIVGCPVSFRLPVLIAVHSQQYAQRMESKTHIRSRISAGKVVYDSAGDESSFNRFPLVPSSITFMADLCKQNQRLFSHDDRYVLIEKDALIVPIHEKLSGHVDDSIESVIVRMWDVVRI